MSAARSAQSGTASRLIGEFADELQKSVT